MASKPKLDLLEKHAKVYELLKKVRVSKTVSLKPIPTLREKIKGIDGTVVDFKLRYYQVQAIFHLISMKRMVLGDDTGTGKCVTGDTLVLTDRGLVPIRQLAPQGELTPDTFYPVRAVRVWTGRVWTPVSKFYWGGPKRTKRVHTREGLEVEGSFNHPILVRTPEGVDKFKPLDQITVEDYVRVPRGGGTVFPLEDPIITFLPESEDFDSRVVSYPAPRRLTPSLARLLGYVVAEGWSNTKNVVHITQHSEINPEAHQDIRQLMRDVFSWSGNANSQTKDHLILATSQYLRAYLLACGVDETTSHAKTVPWCVAQGTRDSVVNFLRGLFEGEASVDTSAGGVEFSTSSESLARGVQLLLLNVGIVAARNPITVPGYDHTYWRVTLFGDEARRFSAEVGFVSHRKQHALDAVLAREAGLESNESYRKIEELANGSVFYSPVTKITESQADVMDLEVEHSDHCFWGNGFVNHNTLCVIASLCYTWQKESNNKVIVAAPKSALHQWAAEVDKFTVPGAIKVYLAVGNPSERRETYREFLEHPVGPEHPKAIMIIGYSPLIRDWNAGATRPLKKNGQPDMSKPMTPGILHSLAQKIPDLTVVYDEAAVFKNGRSKTWQVCSELSMQANRCYGLTATLLKNNLIEGFYIYKCIYPGVFTTKTAFLDLYCVTKMQPVKGGRKIPIVVGYKNLELFRRRIDPFYLGRPKHEISDELPTLITKEVVVTLSKAEDAKYEEALSGILSMGDGEVKDFEEHKKLVALNYCQQVVDSLSLLKYEEGALVDVDLINLESVAVKKLGSKEEAMLDLITDEFDEQKVIVYVRNASLIPRLQKLLKRDKSKKNHIESVAVTGAVVDTKKNPARRNAMLKFQDPKSGVRVIFISDAGSEAINLQAAAAMIFYDCPWSWGTYVQLLGRPIRIGSPHQHVVAVHLVAERADGSKTIDRYTLEILQKKKKLIEAVLGASAKGALEFDDGSFTSQLMSSLRRGGVEE